MSTKRLYAVTKGEQILDQHSRWNQAPNNEPIFVLRAEDWRRVMALAIVRDGTDPMQKLLFDWATAMKEYHDENDIPF